MKTILFLLIASFVSAQNPPCATSFMNGGGATGEVIHDSTYTITGALPTGNMACDVYKCTTNVSDVLFYVPPSWGNVEVVIDAAFDVSYAVLKTQCQEYYEKAICEGQAQFNYTLNAGHLFFASQSSAGTYTIRFRNTGLGGVLADTHCN